MTTVDLDADDRASLAGHVRALGLDDAGVQRLTADAAMVRKVLKLRRLLADLLADAVARDERLPTSVRHAFGVLSDLHEQALRDAVAAGDLPVTLARAVVYDSDAITAALSARRVEVPLRFEAVLGNFRPGERPLAEVRTDAPLPVRTPHGAFLVRVGNGIELQRAATVLTKEPDLIAWLDGTLRPGDVLYDVGANIGVYSLYAAHLPPHVSVVAFEPDPLSFARLTENLWANGFDHALALPVALSDRVGIGEFHSQAAVAGASHPFALDPDAAGAARRAGCVLSTLDALLAQNGAMLPFPTHLKVDVDGPQRAVLAGATGALRDSRLRSVVIEIFEDEIDEVTALLGDAGLRPHSHRWASLVPGPSGRVGNWRFDR